MADRKKAHIDLAFQSQTITDMMDRRFFYEPLHSKHPEHLKPFQFLGKQWKAPLWVSSMTGGTELAGKINRNLAIACKQYGMGMGLGSCRVLLDSNEHLDDFNVRKYIGYELPLYANLGIAQIEKIVLQDKFSKVYQLIDKLQADGLVIHINPMQEWFQPEGDKLAQPPIDTIRSFVSHFHGKIIVKEVGQGIGPDGLTDLLKLPLEAIEFGAFGGTNFAKVELNRNPNHMNQLLEPLTRIGNDALSMLEAVNKVAGKNMKGIKCKQLIISGGIKTFLDGYYLIKKSKLPAVFGMASTFLKYAMEDYDQLSGFIDYQVKGLELANAYLTLRD